VENHSHLHGHGDDPAPLDRRTGRTLTVVVVALLVAAVAGILSTWPQDVPSASTSYVGEEQVRGQVLSTELKTCSPEIAEELLPDGTMPATVDCPEATVRVDGQEITIVVPPAVYHGGLAAGDRVVLLRYPPEVAGSVQYAWSDFDRRVPLAVAVGVFVILTIAIGRRRGLAALVGLGLGGAAIAYYVLPALLAEENAVVVGLSAAIAVMGVVIYLTHGFSTRTTVAYLGTVAGLLVTAVAAVLAVESAHLNGLGDEESYTVSLLTGSLDLRGVVLAGTLVAALGLLNDVTITQAAAVWEVRAADPVAGFRKLFAAGMRVGRDHLASTVYTVTFAYAGAALPTLLLVHLYDQPAGQLLNSTTIAEELLRTAVGGIALALTVPLTTALGAALVVRSETSPPRTVS